MAIVELFRILIDEENLGYEEAFMIIYKTFAYTNHTVLPEAYIFFIIIYFSLEKWSVDLVGNLLPRHMEIIYLINHYFLERVSRKYPGDNRLLSSLSIIEEGTPKKIRMANLSIVCSHVVNGVAEIHTNLLKSNLF
jgi:starch phosphorylase